MVCGEALRSRRCRTKSAAALPTTAFAGLFAVTKSCFASASSRFRPRVMLLINRSQPVERQMRVDLSRRNNGMAQDGLHRTQIGAILHHVRGAGMPQHV